MSAAKRTRKRRASGPANYAKAASFVRSLEQYAERATESGAVYDAAILQFLREHLWALLVESPDLESAAKWVAPILAARRQLLAESKANPASKNSSAQPRDPVLARMLGPELHPPPDEKHP
jgi:hypothetical protein